MTNVINYKLTQLGMKLQEKTNQPNKLVNSIITDKQYSRNVYCLEFKVNRDITSILFSFTFFSELALPPLKLNWKTLYKSE